MATDAKGHTVPAATDHPSRNTLLALSLSITGLQTVANTTARTALVTSWSTAGVPVSTTNPMFLYRTDADELELSTDGTTWAVIPKAVPLAYTPTWSGGATNPTLGNGTLAGNYTIDDQFVDFDISLTIGSTTSVGSGTYTFTLPASPLPGAGRKAFHGIFFDASVGAAYSIVAHCVGTATLNLFQVASPLLSYGAATPVVPAVGDTYHVHGRYKHA